MKQPAVKKFSDEITSVSSLAGAEYIHNFGFYIGIRPFDSTDDIEKIYNTFLNFFTNL
jgi:hypothetical protein